MTSNINDTRVLRPSNQTLNILKVYVTLNKRNKIFEMYKCTLVKLHYLMTGNPCNVTFYSRKYS